MTSNHTNEFRKKPLYIRGSKQFKNKNKLLLKTGKKNKYFLKNSQPVTKASYANLKEIPGPKFKFKFKNRSFDKLIKATDREPPALGWKLKGARITKINTNGCGKVSTVNFLKERSGTRGRRKENFFLGPFAQGKCRKFILIAKFKPKN